MRPVSAFLFAVAAFAAGLPAATASAQPAAPEPTASSAPAAPAQLASAREVVQKIFPEGTYQRIMGSAMSKMVEGISGQAGQMQLREILKMAGLGEAELAKVGTGTLQDLMMSVDPAYQERTRRVTRTMFDEMGRIMSGFEPDVREGLSRAYAHHFTPAQLGDLNTFFSTPTGAAYARDSMVIFMEPEVMEVMQSVTPRLLQQMPAIMEKVQVATADLPKPRDFKDLTPKERARLEQILGKPVRSGK